MAELNDLLIEIDKKILSIRTDIKEQVLPIERKLFLEGKCSGLNKAYRMIQRITMGGMNE